MRYLVTLESLETGLLPPQQLVQVLENQIIPGLEACAKLEAEKKILAGGGFAGRRAGVAIIEAESNEELSQIVQGLPFWGIMKVNVTPLESFENKAKHARQTLERLKAILK
jgi:muconolactone delta-isomerase